MEKTDNKNEVFKKFFAQKLNLGRMISASKRLSDPEHIAVWNANVLTKTHLKVWYGDLNLTVDGSKLKFIAGEIGEPLYVLHEYDCRLGTEETNMSWDWYRERAVWSTTQEIPRRIAETG